MIPFRLPREANNVFSGNVRLPADYVDAKVLAAGVNKIQIVPSGAKVVLFWANCNFYVKPATTSGAAVAVVPAADVTDGTASEGAPTGLYINGNTTHIGLISAEGGIVTMSFYG